MLSLYMTCLEVFHHWRGMVQERLVSDVPARVVLVFAPEQAKSTCWIRCDALLFVAHSSSEAATVEERSTAQQIKLFQSCAIEAVKDGLRHSLSDDGQRLRWVSAWTDHLIVKLFQLSLVICPRWWGRWRRQRRRTRSHSRGARCRLSFCSRRQIALWIFFEQLRNISLRCKAICFTSSYIAVSQLHNCHSTKQF